MGCLYRIEFPNGKSYIGITSKSAEQRFAVHRYQTKGARRHAIYEALRKHGARNAVLKTLVIADHDYLCSLEPRAIEVFSTKVPDGYNMTDGGEGTPNPTVETRAKIGAAHKGKAFHTTRHSAETRAMMSRNRLGKQKRLSQEQREAKRAAMLGNRHSLGRKQSDAEKAMRSIVQRRIPRGGTSGIVGVGWDARNEKWRATLTIRHKLIDLGRYHTVEEATSARLAGEQRHFTEARP